MKRIKWKILLISAIIIAGFTACGKKQGDILPFSSLTPGMTVEEVKAAEPGMDSVSDTVYIVEKEYHGILLSARFDDSRPGNGVIWNCYEEDSQLDKLMVEVKEYCDKTHKLIEEGERDGTKYVLWESGEYTIFMQDFVKGGKRQVDISILR